MQNYYKNMLKVLLIIAAIIIPASGKTKFITQNEIKELESSGLLRAAGTNSWQTKGGLLLTGKDRKGITRLEHVMRHTVNLKKRKKHGVFTISKARIIMLMDNVWKNIKAGALRGKSRGGKTAFTHKTKEPVGYLGGRTGKKKGFPKLKSVRMVLEENTPRVITFFPY